MSCFPGGAVTRVNAGGTALTVETLGAGPCVVLVHGFPHTRVIWRSVAVRLVEAGLRVIAPDLRGLGDSARAATGYDPVTLANDLRAVLDAAGCDAAHVVGTDLGVTSVFALAATHPERVASLTLIEGTLGTLPGAEDFFARGAPWWFGFHQAPCGLAERVVVGAEDDYVRFFLRSGSRHGVPDDVAETIGAAYRGRDSLRCAFEHYRAMPAAAEWMADWARSGRLSMPVLAIGGDTVGSATAGQLRGVADNLRSEMLPGAGHIVCIDDPVRTAEFIVALVRRNNEEEQ